MENMIKPLSLRLILLLTCLGAGYAVLAQPEAGDNERPESADTAEAPGAGEPPHISATPPPEPEPNGTKENLLATLKVYPSF
jgi:hypothetical protein